MAEASTQAVEHLRKDIAQRQAKLGEEERDLVKMKTEKEKDKKEAQTKDQQWEAKIRMKEAEIAKLKQQMQTDERALSEIQDELRKMTQKK